MNIKLLSSILSLTLLLSLSSCSEDPAGGGSTPGKTIPKDQSTFTYNVTLLDGSGNPRAGTDSTYIATVVGDHHSFDGKDTVITVAERNADRPGSQSDTTRVAYESNGDVSLYRGVNGLDLPLPVTLPAPNWWRLPFKSKTSNDIMILDTNVTLNFGIITVTVVRVKITAVSVADAVVTIGTENLNCSTVDLNTIINYTISGFPSALTLKTTYYFSEKIGFFAKYNTQNEQPPIPGIDMGNNIQVLTAYSLK